MKSIARLRHFRFPTVVIAGLLITSTQWLLAQPPAKKEKDRDDQIVVLSPFCIEGSTFAGTRLGATVGGAKDTNYFRDAVKRGEFPHPNTITPEGLFSEYDLPLKSQNKGTDLLLLNGEAMPAKLLTQPEVRYLAQIGFSSGLDARTWHREPLNLIAVVDKSGSMSGPRIALVKDCLHKMLSQLGSHDQLSLVLYGDRAHVFFEPTPVTESNRAKIDAAIDAIEINGSTNMEAGLQVGFELARQSQRSFHGRTRLMQFTDERPNVGDTSAEGFMGLMQAGSRDGIGQTTIGVGEEFGAELAAKVSSVRGGNLFFFADAKEMEKTFSEELDTLVTELAYDLDVKICPAPGLRLTGVYGIPGEMLKWEGDRNVRFHVTTLFLSKRRGAIYLTFAPEAENLPTRSYSENHSLASIQLSYLEQGKNESTASKLELPFIATDKASTGLKRGRILVDEYLALKGAMTAHLIENNQGKAHRLLDEFNTELKGSKDRALRKERQLVGSLLKSMGKLAGHGEQASATDIPEDAIALNGLDFTNAKR
ncbi:MAG: VWA domain-containing protein [Lacunisphaera sp.]